MREVTGNIWYFHSRGNWIAISTNGTVKKDGSCVMGRGVAKQAAEKFHELPQSLGRKIKMGGNRVYSLPIFRMFSFPVKHKWWEKADLALIEESAKQLAAYIVPQNNYGDIYMVAPGTGNGKLTWKEVKPAIEPHLNDTFTIIRSFANF